MKKESSNNCHFRLFLSNLWFALLRTFTIMNEDELQFTGWQSISEIKYCFTVTSF